MLFALIDQQHDQLKDVEIILPPGIQLTIGEFKVVTSGYAEDLSPGIPATYDLGWIPYVAGHYDSGTKKLSEAEKLPLSNAIVTIKKDEEVKIALPAGKVISNDLLLKAASHHTGPVDVILSFGKGKNKAGAFRFTVPASGSVEDYIIHMGSQYNWFAGDRSWISITPQQGEIEISGITLLKEK